MEDTGRSRAASKSLHVHACAIFDLHVLPSSSSSTALSSKLKHHGFLWYWRWTLERQYWTCWGLYVLNVSWDLISESVYAKSVTHSSSKAILCVLEDSQCHTLIKHQSGLQVSLWTIHLTRQVQPLWSADLLLQLSGCSRDIAQWSCTWSRAKHHTWWCHLSLSNWWFPLVLTYHFHGVNLFLLLNSSGLFSL